MELCSSSGHSFCYVKAECQLVQYRRRRYQYDKDTINLVYAVFIIFHKEQLHCFACFNDILQSQSMMVLFSIVIPLLQRVSDKTSHGHCPCRKPTSIFYYPRLRTPASFDILMQVLRPWLHQSSMATALRHQTYTE
jgi:hypothetical protein